MINPLWQQPGLDRLIGILVASVALFLVEIVMSHITHSLTLLAVAYHMLYNIFSLIGCIATIKVIHCYAKRLHRLTSKQNEMLEIHLNTRRPRELSKTKFSAYVNNTWTRAKLGAAIKVQGITEESKSVLAKTATFLQLFH